ncbi:MAG TPA: hypothetical protein VFA42_04080, partial [Gaiellaceae bacterium]|nr:hypothetical protein [Gaiellaceae bacterium]
MRCRIHIPALTALRTRVRGEETGIAPVEAYLTSLSISDFQMLSASSISYGSTATTTGWVYATVDDSGNEATI